MTAISPATGITTGGDAVTITGSNFASGATVTFGGSAASNVVVQSPTQLTATTPAHTAGTVDVVVTTPNSLSGTLVNGFTYRWPMAFSADRMIVTAGYYASATIIFARPQTSDTVITLISNSSIASVASSVTMPANTTSVLVNVKGVAAGTTTLNASVNLATGAVSSGITVSVRAASGSFDTGTIANVATKSGSAVIPIYFRDVSGTPLDSNSIINMSLRIAVAPAGALSAASIARAGVTASLTTRSESSSVTANSISYNAIFTTAISLTRDAPAPGDKIAEITLTLATPTVGQKVSLTLDSSTAFSNDPGPPHSQFFVFAGESVADGTLALMGGSVFVPRNSGDGNNDGSLTVADVFSMINHLFSGGPLAGDGDANGDGVVSVADVFYLINHLFAGGPAPGATLTVNSANSTSLPPLTTLSMSATNFDPTAPAAIRFSQPNGFTVDVPATLIGSAFTSPVPPLFDATGTPSSGVVRIELAQQKGSTAIVSNAIDGFTIQSLPALATQAGRITLEWIRGAAALGSSLQTALASAPWATQALKDAVAAEQTQLSSLATQVQSLVSNPATTLTLGTEAGKSVVVRTSDLAIVDRQIVQLLVDIAAAGACQSAEARAFAGSALGGTVGTSSSFFTAATHCSDQAFCTSLPLVVGGSSVGEGFLALANLASTDALLPSSALLAGSISGANCLLVTAGLAAQSTEPARDAVRSCARAAEAATTRFYTDRVLAQTTGTLSSLLATQLCDSATAPLPLFAVTITVNGTGSGSVNLDPSLAAYPFGSAVTLTAVPVSGSVFAGWGGACSGSLTTCTLTITSNVSVTATFNIRTQSTLTVTKVGSGTVVSSPAGIQCGAQCSATYPVSTTVTLTATGDAPRWVFSNWTGACGGSAPTCTLTLDTDKTATAVFTSRNQLSVTLSGGGLGSVTSSPPGVDCGTTCAGFFIPDSTVTLTANTVSGSYFAGWTGACAGNVPTCTVIMSGDQAVGAQFQRGLPLTITPASIDVTVKVGQTPSPVRLTLSNSGVRAISFLDADSVSWIDPGPASGFVPAGGTNFVDVHFPNVSTMPVGTYTHAIDFTLSDGITQIYTQVGVTLHVVSSVIAGSWQGSWTVTSGPSACRISGTWTANFVDNGNGTLSGTWSSSVGLSGSVTGTVSGNTVTWTGGGSGVTFTGTVSGTSISGTFTDTANCPYGTVTGTFTGSRTGP